MRFDPLALASRVPCALLLDIRSCPCPYAIERTKRPDQLLGCDHRIARRRLRAGVEHCRGYIQSWHGQGNPIPERSAQRILKAADQILKVGTAGTPETEVDR